MADFIKGIGSAAQGFAVGNSEVEAMYLGETKIYEKLPYDAKIKYLQSAGSQYIYIQSGQITKIKIKFQFTSDKKQQRIVCLGTNTYENASLNIYENGAGNIATSINKDWQSSNTVSYNTLCTVTLDGAKKKTTVTKNDGTTVTWDHSVSPVYSNNFYLFRSATSNEYGYAKLYYCKMYNGSNLVFNLIPVRVGQVGYMYDNVSKTLFGNAGSGSFTLGPDV